MLQIKTANGVENKKIVSRKEWSTAREELLQAEKELTRQSDALAQKRQQLPWVRITKPYIFETEKGRLSLPGLFEGRSQLLVYHFMFGPDYKAGCPSCSSIADSFDEMTIHLKNHDVMFWVISRAPFEKLREYKQRMGWRFPWASSNGNDFNFDFGVSFTEQQQQEGLTYNYQKEPPMFPEVNQSAQNVTDGPGFVAGMTGTDITTFTKERPGMSAFAYENGQVYHTYSAFSRGLDALWNTYQWLDRAPLGRNEKGYWLKRHDEYGTEAMGKKSCCS